MPGIRPSILEDGTFFRRNQHHFRPFDDHRLACRIEGRRAGGAKAWYWPRFRVRFCDLRLLSSGIIIKYLIVLVIILLLFSSRLPSLARSLGQSLIEFKKGIKELENSSDDKKSE